MKTQRERDWLAEEREKYLHVYEHVPTYGHTNHAQGIYWYLEDSVIPCLPQNSISLVLDVGCGHGEFLRWLHSRLPDRDNICLIGTDVTAAEVHGAPAGKGPVHFLHNPAWDLGFETGAVDVLTAFDVLEHIPPAMLDLVMEEFRRVCRGTMIFSVGHRSSKKCGMELHQTIQSMPWWRDYLEFYFPGRVELAVSRHPLASEYFIVSPP